MRSLKDIIRKNISNIPGWRTRRKILVIESDDWGSVRIKDKQAYEALKQQGMEVDRKRYDQVDTLESNDDLELLFYLLKSFKDKNGHAAKFTPMCLVGNPDFDKIKASNYQKYHFEPLDETISEFQQSDQILSLWREGFKYNIFVPELHGREHVNVRRYLDILQNNEAKEGLRFALNYHSLGPSSYNGKTYPNYLGALFPITKEEIQELKEHLLQAGELFEQFTGYNPRVFMAPNAEEPKELEETLKQIGVQYLTRAKRRIYPMGDGVFGKEWNFVGKVNECGQLILNRNAFFEPCQKDEGKTLDSCLKEIDLAFRWGKPAVVSSHRVNYVGSISEDNRKEGLSALRALLKTVLNKWPDVEFMTSFELGETIRKDKMGKVNLI
jgi:hypothetical protein